MCLCIIFENKQKGVKVVLESKQIAVEIKCNFESCADTITRRENDKESKANKRALEDDDEKRSDEMLKKRLLETEDGVKIRKE